MSKVRKEFMITKALEEKVIAYSKQSGLSQAEVINQALKYFFKHGGRDFPEFAKLFDTILKGNFKPLIEEQKRTRLAVNQMAKESQMNIELWNNHYLKNGDGTAITTNVNKAFEVEQAEAKVQNEILRLQQKKHS